MDKPGTKFIIISAATGFSLSFLIGVFSRIYFLTILFRALFFAGLFFGLAYGIVYVLGRLLKDIPQEEAASWTEETGENVNIVLPEEPIAPPEIPETMVSLENQSSEELEREIELVKNEQFVVDTQDSSARSKGPISRPMVTQDDLDVLPDIDSMSDAFSELSVSGESSEPEPLINYSGSAPKSPGYDKESPEIIAKAVQTLIQQDKKGT